MLSAEMWQETYPVLKLEPKKAQLDKNMNNDPVLCLNHGTQTEHLLHSQIKVPILGYEIMEQRARFTVFKINVQRGENDSWCIFRRYTDFLRLNKKLSGSFPGCRFSLPPKRWFGDNFDPRFLENRLQGLQAFINNLIGHHTVFSRSVKFIVEQLGIIVNLALLPSFDEN